MMEIIGCRNCGQESTPFGMISVNVILSKSHYCEHCRDSKTENQNYFFCSVKCLQEYAARIEWKENEF